jgi:hypothetical protein
MNQPQSKIMLGWKDFPEIGKSLSRMAHENGCSVSDIVRLAVRDRIKAFEAGLHPRAINQDFFVRKSVEHGCQGDYIIRLVIFWQKNQRSY